MKARSLLLLLVSLFFSVPIVSAQQQIVLTGGHFERGYYDTSLGTTGTFHFTGPNSDLNGSFVGSGGSGIYAYCDQGNPSCVPGGTFRLMDDIYGHTAFRDNITPVTVNGTNYQNIRFNESAVRFDAGTVRIPWNVGKRKTVRLTYPVHVTGHLNGAWPITPIFFSSVDLWGTVTVEFSRQDSSSPVFKYFITKVTYNFAAPGN